MTPTSRNHLMVWISIVPAALAAACNPRIVPASGQIDAGFGSTWSIPDAEFGRLPPPTDAVPRDVVFGQAARACKVPADDLNGAPATCTRSAPAMAFQPKLKWSWSEPVPRGSVVTPLVANLTDDNGDGAIDLCDVPDVVVTSLDGHLYVLAGDTGKLELQVASDPKVTPALGDLDGDGVPEIVTLVNQQVTIYDHRGRMVSQGDTASPLMDWCGALSIYDLDADGSPEIIAAASDVFDARGHLRFRIPAAAHALVDHSVSCPTNTAADLDGDGKLEVLLGGGAYHADGKLAFALAGPPGHPHVANFDSDPDPEIMIAAKDGLRIFESDGKLKWGPIVPPSNNASLGDGDQSECVAKPSAVHDLDGDRVADLAVSTCDYYAVLHGSATGFTVAWKAPVQDPSGISSSTAFDFLGRGIAQAVYADEQSLFVFDGQTGKVDLRQARTSTTYIEYPVVADVDDDGSADIVVVSQPTGATMSPTVQVFEDAEKRWIPARRIWNQHAYHVTNVREDGTIPRVLPKSWLMLNTFRTNGQIDGVRACLPPLIK
jgi:hypothetical protein